MTHFSHRRFFLAAVCGNVRISAAAVPQADYVGRLMAFVDRSGSLLYDFLDAVFAGGRLAQLVRAPALQAGGRRFKSCTAHHFHGGGSSEAIYKARILVRSRQRLQANSGQVILKKVVLRKAAKNCDRSAVRAVQDHAVAVVNGRCGDVVQLVRTLPCHGRGREFESRRPRHFLT